MSHISREQKLDQIDEVEGEADAFAVMALGSLSASLGIAADLVARAHTLVNEAPYIEICAAKWQLAGVALMSLVAVLGAYQSIDSYAEARSLAADL